MSDIKLFKLCGSNFQELKGETSDLEKPLQTLIERNLESLLGIRFVASEYSTGKTHSGRIDTLGLDENSCPVILEYKRSTGENVINQGLFYLDWLMDHQAEYTLLVQKQFGHDVADEVDWSSPRLVCIAADFTKYDAHAVQQINRNIELLRYRKFGGDLLLLELVNAVTESSATIPKNPPKSGSRSTDRTAAESIAELSDTMKEIFSSLETFLLSLGDDVQRKDLKLYVAFKRIKNIACVVFYKDRLALHVRFNPGRVALEEGFTRDVSDIGHWGTGNLEITLRTLSDLEKAKPLLQRAYEGE